MGRVVVANFVTIDGVIQSPLSPSEDPDGGFRHGGWVSAGDDAVDAFMRDVTLGATGMLLGRRTYEILRDRTDGALVVLGSGALVSSLAEHDLVDEYRILVFPVVLGGGKRMSGERSALARYELVGSATSPRGVVILTYARAR